jgi:hypothetical protein
MGNKRVCREKPSRTLPGVLCFGVETPHAVLTALLTCARASIALTLGLILELTDLGSPVRRALALSKVGEAATPRSKSPGALRARCLGCLQLRAKAEAMSWGCSPWRGRWRGVGLSGIA